MSPSPRFLLSILYACTVLVLASAFCSTISRSRIKLASLRINLVTFLFVDKHIVLHLIDRATRWHAATLVESKTGKDLLPGIDAAWVRIHGPMKDFIVDGEMALGDPEFLRYFNLRGINRCVRAPGQHSRYVERRGDLLRTQLHLIMTQMKELGIEMPSGTMLSEAVFAGNAMLTNDSVSPYIAVYGPSKGPVEPCKQAL